MTWAMIISVVIEILKQRAAAGWPLLNLLLERWGIKIQEDADNDTTPITVGAAPSELKDQIVAWLEVQKAKAGIGMKFVYTILIRAVPLVIDQIWDNFFAKGIVPVSFASFGTPPTVSSAGEDEILVDVL